MRRFTNHRLYQPPFDVFDPDLYRRFCEDQEPKNSGTAGMWSTKSSDEMFIPAGPPGELDGAGASRWRQRAFYDYLKDAWYRLGHVRPLRISVWEEIDGPDGPILVDKALLGMPDLVADIVVARLGAFASS